MSSYLWARRLAVMKLALSSADSSADFNQEPGICSIFSEFFILANRHDFPRCTHDRNFNQIQPNFTKFVIFSHKASRIALRRKTNTHVSMYPCTLCVLPGSSRRGKSQYCRSKCLIVQCHLNWQKYECSSFFFCSCCTRVIISQLRPNENQMTYM